MTETESETTAQTVYCLIRHVNYEGSNVLGLYDSEEKAMDAAQLWAKSCEDDYYGPWTTQKDGLSRDDMQVRFRPMILNELPRGVARKN